MYVFRLPHVGHFGWLELTHHERLWAHVCDWHRPAVASIITGYKGSLSQLVDLVSSTCLRGRECLSWFTRWSCGVVFQWVAPEVVVRNSFHRLKRLHFM
jgi:hypothetical protein